MTKIDIFSGFLGAGKTTLIKKLIGEAFQGEKLVLIENEFGEIGVDGAFLQNAGIQVTEMNSGCICCSLVGDFRVALHQVVEQYHPDRILIEPSGVGKLSDVTRAVESVAEDADVVLDAFITVADVNKVKLYMKNFGEFYNDQIEHASAIFLSRTKGAKQEKIAAAVELLREKNPKATITTTDWDELTGEQMIAAMQTREDFVAQLLEEARAASLKHEEEHEHEHHHHHDHDHEEHECCCGHHHHEEEHEHHHDHDEHECCHHHHEEEHEHHHDHDHECCHHHHEEEHEHHHEHDHECCHHHHEEEHEHHHEHHYDEHGVCSCGHHHHHHADEVFTSWGKETARPYTRAELEFALKALDEGQVGMILRAKGVVAGEDCWFEFDYVPGEYQIRERKADVIGRLCVIGSQLNEAAVAALFCQ